MNSVILIGRLTAAPELKTTTNGNPVTSFKIAVDRKYSGADGKKITDFINCVAWRNAAEFISKFFRKGDPIAIIGEIQPRKYKDKDGNNRVAVEVVINDARFVPSKSNDNSGTPNNPTFVNADFDEMSGNDEDLPF